MHKHYDFNSDERTTMVSDRTDNTVTHRHAVCHDYVQLWTIVEINCDWGLSAEWMNECAWCKAVKQRHEFLMKLASESHHMFICACYIVYP